MDNLVVGVIGAVLGGFLFGLLGFASGGLIGSLITALVGAIVLLAIVGALALVVSLRWLDARIGRFWAAIVALVSVFTLAFVLQRDDWNVLIATVMVAGLWTAIVFVMIRFGLLAGSIWIMFGMIERMPPTTDLSVASKSGSSSGNEFNSGSAGPVPSRAPLD